MWRSMKDVRARVVMNRPERTCPRCGAAGEIRDGEALWPAGWSCQACAHRIEMRNGIPVLAPALADTLTGMNPAAFERLARREGGNYWFVPRSRLIESVLARYFPDAECMMEIGCGTGFVLSGLANMKPWRRLVGSELHPAGLAFACSRLGRGAEFIQMDARAIPVHGAFDVIGAFDVLEHIEDDEAVLAAMYQALRVQGGVLLTVPQHPWLWSSNDERALHVRRYRRGELETKLRAAGFHMLFSASYTALLLPLMAASRWTRPAGKPNAPASELEMAPIANFVLKAVLQFEVTLTLAGIHFPAGGSRIIVAAKTAAATKTAA
jgi:SAM-dependent methyltransferase